MANEINFRHSAAAATLYAQVLDSTGSIYNGSTFETIADANWGTYDIAMTEAGTASQIYQGTFPVVSAGIYTIFVYIQAGGSPAVGDTLAGVGKVEWDGTAELSLTGAVADVWGYATRTLTQGAASVTAAVDGETITMYRDATWIIPLTGLGSIATYDTIYFSVKETVTDSEDDAILRVYNNASGLERFNKAAPVAATNGVITIDDAIAGDITITIQEAETVNAPLHNSLRYDVKGIDNDGSVLPISANGKFVIEASITRAITTP